MLLKHIFHPKKYTGFIDIDPCSPNPCQNTGTCDVVNGFSVCNCNSTGYTGDKCNEGNVLRVFDCFQIS